MRYSSPHNIRAEEEEPLTELGSLENGNFRRTSEGKLSPKLSRGSMKPLSSQGIHPSYIAPISCLIYCFCSVTMVLANKGLAARFDADIDFLTIAFQSVCAIVLVEFSGVCASKDPKGQGVVMIQAREKIQTAIALKWLPVNCFFVSMLFTGFLSLRYLNVPMVTIFKNLTNVGILFGEWAFQGQPISSLVLLSCFMMLLGAILAAANDITFSAVGYFWMIANCVCTASYVLYMKHATKTIKLSKIGMVYYNNLLSIPILVVGAYFRGEFTEFFSREDLHSLPYLSLSLYAGMVGFCLNLATLWCVSNTTATTYAVVGALNKIPLAFIGYFLFKTPMTSETVVFISLSMIGGFVYTYAKLREAQM